MPQPSLATLMDYSGRIQRQRKVRLIRRDTREHAHGELGTKPTITDVLLTGRGFTIERRALRFGDYGWDLRPESALFKAMFPEVVIERKTLADLRDTDRLTDQLHRAYREMSSNGWHPFYIVLIDYTEDTTQWAWSEEQILNAELSIQLGKNFYVTRAETGLLADRLESLYTYTSKPTHSLGR